MFNRILVPIDGSATSNKALVAALQLAREQDARVRLVHALDELAFLTGRGHTADLLQQMRNHAENVLKDGLAIAASAGVPAQSNLLELGRQRLGEVIAEEARRIEADLIVVGTHGRRGVGRVLLGSGAEQIVRLSAVPVLVIRADGAAETK